MGKLKVGVIGVGHMGNYHARVYHKMRHYVEFVGVCDINKARADEIAALYNTKAYYTHQEMLHDVDAVTIAVPTVSHYEVAKNCLVAGKHILLEKPITDNLEHAKDLIEIAEKKDLVFHAGHVERFNAAVLELMRYSVEIEPLFLEARRLGPLGNRVRTSGVILDLMIHDIDIVLNLLKSEVEGITAVGKSLKTPFEDIAHVQLYFKSGAIASLAASRITQTKIRTLSITMPESYIFLDYAEEDIYVYSQGGQDYTVGNVPVREIHDTNVQRIIVNKDNPLKLEIEHFIECIMENEISLYSTIDNLRSLEVALKAESLAMLHWKK